MIKIVTSHLTIKFAQLARRHCYITEKENINDVLSYIIIMTCYMDVHLTNGGTSNTSDLYQQIRIVICYRYIYK